MQQSFFVDIPRLKNNLLYVLKYKTNFLKKELILIYSSSDSSEEKKLFKLSLICLITFFSWYLHSFSGQ